MLVVTESCRICSEKNVSKGADDAYYMLEAKRNADMDYLSKVDIASVKQLYL